VKSWCRSPALERFLPLIDDPQPWYPEVVKESLSAGEFGPEAVKALRAAHARYPAFSGIARTLAYALKAQNKFSEAVAALERGETAACCEEGRKTCRRVLRSFRFEQACSEQKFADAAQLGLEMLEEDDDNPAMLVQNVLIICVNVAQQTGTDPGCQRLRKAVAGWIRRARARLGDAQEQAVAEAEIEKVKQVQDECLVQIVFLVNGGGTKEPDWERVVAALDALEAEDPELVDIHYYRMEAQYAILAQASHVDPAKARARLPLLRKEAKQVLERSANERHQEAARKRLSEIAHL
jgi:hypothetical protein